LPEKGNGRLGAESIARSSTLSKLELIVIISQRLAGKKRAAIHNDSTDIAVVTQVIPHERQGRDRSWRKQTTDAYRSDSEVNISRRQGTGQEFAARSFNAGFR
jgi:hypothetical protein